MHFCSKPLPQPQTLLLSLPPRGIFNFLPSLCHLFKCECRCPHPGGLAPTSKVMRGLSSWMVDARGNIGTHGLSWFRPRGRTSSKGVYEGTVLSCTGGACSRGYKRGERGREAPKSLLEEMIEASANIGAQKSVCAL